MANEFNAFSDWSVPTGTYRDQPTPAGNTVSYQPGVLMTEAVWEECTVPNSTQFNYRQAVGFGGIWPTQTL